jgi:hypothetical protein
MAWRFFEETVPDIALWHSMGPFWLSMVGT